MSGVVSTEDVFGYAGHSALIWTTTSICIILVGARLLFRQRVTHLGVDDFLMLHAVAMFILGAALTQSCLKLPETQNFDALAAYNSEAIYSSLAFNSVLVFAKASVAFQLCRILGPTSRWRKAFLMSTSWGLVALSIVTIPAQISPVCDPDVPASIALGCLSPETEFVASQVYNVYNAFVDVAYSIIPATFVFGLRIAIRKRVMLTALLSLGWLAGVFTLLRVIYNFDLYEGSDNTQYLLRLQTIFSWMDHFLPIVCGNLVAVAPIFQHWTFKRPWRSIGSGLGQHARQAEGDSRPSPRPNMGSVTANPLVGSDDWPMPRVSDATAPTIRLTHEFNEDRAWRLSSVV